MNDASSYERAKQIALELGFTYKRDHSSFVANRVSTAYFRFLKALSANATALTSAYLDLSRRSSTFQSVQDTLSQTGPKLLVVPSEKSDISIGEDDSNSLNEIINHNKEIEKDALIALCNMFAISMVSSFEAYIQEVLREIFLNYPETLRSGRVITYEEILQHTDMPELIFQMAQTEALKSTEGPVGEYLRRIEKRFGIKKLGNADIEKVVALRNSIVHNGGIVDSAFVRYYPDGLQEGDSIKLTLQDAANISETVRLTVEIAEIQLVAQKFPIVGSVEWSEQADIYLDYAFALEEFSSSTE